MFKLSSIIAFTVALLACITSLSAEFIHPGVLSTQADLDRMAAKVAAGEQPWIGSWEILVKNTDKFMDDAPLAQKQVSAGGSLPENYIRLARDSAKAYQLALRYRISGDDQFADKAVEILNAWSHTHDDWRGDTNIRLRAGIYGYQLACAAELLRDYPGWASADFAAFQKYLLTQYIPHNRDFLANRHGTVPDHYWANWVHANMAAMMAIGVVCDDQAIFDEGLEYFYHGQGNGNIEKAVNFIHPNGLGQWQESGRDQGHTQMGPQLVGVICEIAWNQGIDLYSYDNNRFLAGVEYISKYNLGEDVPYVVYVREWKHPGKSALDINEVIAPKSRGELRSGWDLVYNHYVNRMGIAAPYTQQYAEQTRPEGGGYNYGGNSGGFDSLGFTTLTHSLDQIETGVTPGSLRPFVQGNKITLSWAGSAYAESYNVKRSSTAGGPYEVIAKVETPDLYFEDTDLPIDQTYFYVVSANIPDGESDDSIEASATTTLQLYGEIIGTEGSLNDEGSDNTTVFDGSLTNFFDAPTSAAWVGLDFGPDQTSIITEVKYCPRKDLAARMVGGKFQGSNSPDFSDGVVDLCTIKEVPAEGVLTEQKIDNKTAFRYVRYVAPRGSYGNVAEIEFYGETFETNARAL